MQVARVVGTVVCAHKDPRLEGVTLLILQPVSFGRGAPSFFLIVFGGWLFVRGLFLAGAALFAAADDEKGETWRLWLGVRDACEQAEHEYYAHHGDSSSLAPWQVATSRDEHCGNTTSDVTPSPSSSTRSSM